MKATNIRKGNIVLIKGVLYKVLVMDHVTPGKGRAHVQTKLRNLADGTQTEMRFRSDEDVNKAFLETREMQYLYSDQDGYHFMDTETYEQQQLTAETLGDGVKYIVPDTTIMMQTHEGNPLGIELPPVVELKVIETPPGVKDATASAQRKPAKMETGLVVSVPPFIKLGEILKIDTRSGEYITRVKN